MAKQKQKAEAKRKATPVVGDMQPLMEALPELSFLTTGGRERKPLKRYVPFRDGLCISPLPVGSSVLQLSLELQTTVSRTRSHSKLNPFRASLDTRKKDEMCLVNLQVRGKPHCLDEAWHETDWEHPDVLGVAGVARRCPHCNAAELT